MEKEDLFSIFCFLLAFPFLSVFGNNVTFYIFLLLLYNSGRYFSFKSNGRGYFYIFFIIILVSTLFSFFIDIQRHPGLLNVVKSTVKYLYWVLIPVYLISYSKKINILKLTKSIFIGSNFLILGFYLSHSSSPIDIINNYDFGIMELNFNYGRNPFVFNLLAIIPINYYYLFKSRTKIFNIVAYTLFILVIMLLTNGRAGFLILVIELLFIYSIYNINFSKYLYMILIPVLIINISSAELVEEISDNIAETIQPISPRVSELIRGEGESGDLSSDKSWLVRQLMIDKGFEIVKKYPLTGLGPNNFSFYDADMIYLRNYPRLFGYGPRFYNSLSAHNSYIKLISEIGVIGFLVFIIIIYKPLNYFFRKIRNGSVSINDIPYISLIGICIHFFVFSALAGAISWFVIGLSWALYNRR